jgi:hypothetical protein
MHRQELTHGRCIYLNENKPKQAFFASFPLATIPAFGAAIACVGIVALRTVGPAPFSPAPFSPTAGGAQHEVRFANSDRAALQIREGYMNSVAKLLALCVICGAAGCTSYYHVHDPSTGRDYYTTDMKQDRSGSTTLKDARTGNEVTIQNSEVQKISKEQFESAKYAQPAPANQPGMTSPQRQPG